MVVEYTVKEGGLPCGSTLGSPKAVAVIKATGALDKLYSCEAGGEAFCSVLVWHWDARSGIELRARSGHFEIAPERQEHFIEYPRGLSSRERIFLLNARAHDNGDTVDPPGLFYTVSLRNDGGETAHIKSAAAIQLALRSKRISTRFDDRRGAVIVCDDDRPQFVRIAASSPACSGHEISGNVATFYFEHQLKAGHDAVFTILLTFSIDGEQAALANLTSLPAYDDALARTQAYYRSMLERAIVLTPEEEVNRGVVWAKVNMLRSLLLPQQGWCIVNDPAETTHVVGRDTAWFALGASYVMPWFAAESLRRFFDHLTDSGMAPEWYDSCTGEIETDDLDINDDTPLLLWATWHHFCCSGDSDFLRSVYPNVLRAARLIVSKRGARGLVWCHAPGKGGRGIVGWRNALQDDRLSGATTELNSECYGAFRAVASIAAQLNDPPTAEQFARHAEELRAAINANLLDRSRNVYDQAIDEEGRRRTEITTDLVFPLLFGVADDEVAGKIVETLSLPEFWSDAGLHSVPRNAIDYSPEKGAGLRGGVWAGPTFWFAKAAAALNPELMVDALITTFRHYAEHPLRYNTVPGEFCEWLHGETLTNRGMMLSPWFAPKYLWASIEGAAGLDVTPRAPQLQRRLPPAWPWLAARKVMVRGAEISWFAVRMESVTTYLASQGQVLDADHIYDEDITADVTFHGDEAVCVALGSGTGVVIFVGNTSEHSIVTAVALRPARLPHRARLRVYDSVARAWSAYSDVENAADRWRVNVGRKGFAILEFAGGSS